MSFGWLPDPHDPRDYDARDMPGLMGEGPTGTALDTWLDLTAHAPPIRNQTVTNTCVLQAVCDAWLMTARIAGRSSAVAPSTMHGYYLARALEGSGHIVEDRGCFPRLAMQALTRFGLCAEERFPFDPRRINTPPPWDAHQHAADARGAEYYRISGYDDERLTMVARALSAGHPVVFGTVVDRSLIDASSDIVGRAKGTIEGRHAMLIVGRSQGAWVVRNSWGGYWGTGGYARLSDDRVASTDCDDFRVITLAPEVS